MKTATLIILVITLCTLGLYAQDEHSQSDLYTLRICGRNDISPAIKDTLYRIGGYWQLRTTNITQDVKNRVNAQVNANGVYIPNPTIKCFVYDYTELKAGAGQAVNVSVIDRIKEWDASVPEVALFFGRTSKADEWQKDVAKVQIVSTTEMP